MTMAPKLEEYGEKLSAQPEGCTTPGKSFVGRGE